MTTYLIIPMTSSAKPLYLSAALLLLIGCSSNPTAQIQPSPALTTISNSPVPQQAPKATGTKASINGWEVAVTDVRPGGRVYKNDYTEYEAAKSWTIVSISITNKTGERQQDDNAPGGGLWSKMIDSTGKEYDLEEIEYVDLTNKPFSPGETRAEILLFDTPENIKPVQLVLDPSDDGSPRLKLN